MDYLIKSQTLTDVANAIRTKGGTSGQIQVSNFDTAIANLPMGANLDDYFYTECTANTSNTARFPVFKKAVPVIVTDNVTSLYGMFNNYNSNQYLPQIIFNNNVTDLHYLFDSCNSLLEVNTSGWNTSNVTNIERLFYGCSSLTSIDLSNLDFTKFNTNKGNNSNGYNIFYNCSSLQFLDIRTLELSKLTKISATTFNNVPYDCVVIVKNQTEKDFVLTQRSDFINVKTVAEYENE